MNSVENLTEHEVYELMKLQDDLAWRLVWEKAVLAEAKSLRSARMAREWGVTPEELMGILYEDMIGKGKIELFRDDGGSLWGWLGVAQAVRAGLHPAGESGRARGGFARGGGRGRLRRRRGRDELHGQNFENAVRCAGPGRQSI